ncbi:nuclear envelope pore membrane protein POM 121 [Lepisosteus oculatus]|uniref:nuclear envelope pore membrane protein POM 121 n=1 Tax=Lepisosteus oculatus TaxID=7918 RepID=UPI00371C2717
MSPREKRRIALISVALLAVAIFCFALYYIPTFLYVLFILGVCTVACFCHAGGPSQHTRLGPQPRPALAIPPALRRWLPGKTANGVPSAGRVSSRGHQGRPGKGELGDSAAPRGERRWEVRGAFQKEAEGGGNGSFVFSPRDLLMGSYLSKADSPGAGGASRELRERLARPNHAVHTPNRRLSFGDSLGAAGRFSITPQRHYPLQQPGCPSLGPLPPVQWDGCRRKNVLTPRNSPAARSPVTVKIARPEPSRTRSPLFDRLSSPLTALAPGLGASVDPCSKEAVLTALKEGRKREVEEEEGRSCSEGQESKRRRHDSSGSAHSAFEPLLANGVPSQLVPKPGTLKRGANALLTEETLMKRSRTSSVSSLSSGLAPSGVLGSARNPILSSYSSSRGCLQQKKTPALSLSPLSSPGSSRSQTPERPTKKLREEEAFSSTFLSAAKSDSTPKSQARETEKPSPAPTVPVAPSSPASRGTEGKRKRKIQLVSSRRGDSITLPPPPELGYSITVSDLDSEKKAALHRIRKVLEEPEPAKPTPAPAVPLFSQAAVSASSPLGTASLLLYTSTAGAPTPPSVSIAAPASNPGMAGIPPSSSSSSSSGVAPASSTAASPLLESLRKMQNSPALSTAPNTGSPAAGAETPKTPVVTFSMSSPPVLASSILGAAPVKTEPGPAPAQLPQPAASASQPSATPAAPPAASSGSQTGALSFGLASTAQPMAALSFATTTTTSAPNAKPLLSAFKPVFGAPAPAVTSSSAATTFKPVFGGSTASSAFGQPVGTTGGAATTSSATAATSAASIFTGLSASTSAPASGTQTPAKPAFGSWGAGASVSTAAPASTAGGAFQFSAAAAATAVSAAPTFNSSGSAFPFGKPAASTAPAQSAPQAAFTFGQGSSGQTPAAGAFGSFGAPPASTAPGPAASQATFAFGKPSFDGPATFGSAAPAAAAKPFTFGASGAAGATPFSFGGATTTTAAPSFGTPSQPAFGSGSAGFSFGTTTAAAAAPAFGSTTQTSAPLPVPTPSFSFGAAAGAQASAPPASQGAPQPTAGFSFGAGLSSAQFAAPAAPSPAFSFGASNAKDSKPAFGTPTPAFGQSSSGGPLPFGSPGTPAPGFGGLTSTPFGATPGASFSIGSGSKSSARQRLQARRQHPRKK